MMWVLRLLIASIVADKPGGRIEVLEIWAVTGYRSS